jgi:8-oxo-dGTP pyrophosphatase MutT (NUDIX family)
VALELNQEIVESEPVPAATVMVLRETRWGPEVLMLRRNAASRVLGGACVFPGGKVDTQLDTVRPEQLLPNPIDLRQRLNEPDTPLEEIARVYTAAVRETAEECGLLLGWGGATQEQLELAMVALHQGQPMQDMLALSGWRLDANALHPWSRWVTPKRPSVTKRRFDTRFFVAELPAGQSARHDGHEITASAWMRPQDALQRYWQGEFDLAAPQIITLQHLGRFSTVAEILAFAKRHTPRAIHPEPFEDNGHRVTCYPGDPRHTAPHPAWPGPTRLTFRDGRFEPDRGLDELLG